MATIRQSIERVRAFARAQGWTKSRLARQAGMIDTTLRDFHRDDWNPTAETIRRLEAVIRLQRPRPGQNIGQKVGGVRHLMLCGSRSRKGGDMMPNCSPMSRNLEML